MGKCTACGKSGLFLRINSFGRCSACQESFEIADNVKQKEKLQEDQGKKPALEPLKEEPKATVNEPVSETILTEEEFQKAIEDIDFKIYIANETASALKERLDFKWDKVTFDECKKAAEDAVVFTDKKVEMLKNRMAQLEKTTQDNSSMPEKNKEVVEIYQTDFVETIGDYKLAYKYGVQNVAGTKYNGIDYDALYIGDSLDFVLEPENEYDPKAIKITYDDNTLGHVYKGQLQDMISDWLTREDLIVSKIVEVDEVSQSIKYVIAFYKKA